ncbi:MAG: helix-turn-helix transcriptional regulator [Oscillospiraceae bacterium]|nr:helix-turn-helix transcriptional regulator [Oscillospiraceae bacterium]
MNTRISFVRKNAKLNQQEFAAKIGLTKNFISLLETGDRKPSDRTISDICREFGVDRIWLETGAGEPFKPVDRDEQIAAILGRAIAGNTTARDRLIRAFSQLPDEMFEQAEKILEEIVENLQKEKE